MKRLLSAALLTLAACAGPGSAPREPDPRATEALFAAIEANDLSGVHRTIDAGADLRATKQDASGLPLHFTPLQTATILGRSEVAAALIDAGAEVDAAGESFGTALHLAILFGQAGVAEVLVQNGADVNAVVPVERKTALDLALLAGSDEIVDMLRRHGAKTSE